MYPTSDQYKLAIKSHFREEQNATLEFDDLILEKKWVRNISFSHLLSDSEYLQLGSIASKKVEIELNDLDGTLKSMKLSAKYFNLFYIFAGEKVPIGKFRVDGNPDKSEKNVVKITAFDRLYYADTKYYCMLGDSYTAKDLMLDALSQCEIEIADEELLNSINFDIKQTYVPENLTCRQVISMCAEIAGCMAVMTRDDKLNFIAITNNMEVSGMLDIGNCYDMTFAETDFIVDGLRYYEGEDSYLKAGNGKKRIICLSSSNFLVNQKVLDNLYNIMNGLSFRPFKCPRYDGDPSVDAGDVLTVSDIKGVNTYKVMPLIVTWKFNGGLQGTLENNASISETVVPKDTTTLEQKINQTYHEKAGITYAYNSEKVILGLRETTLCDIKFSNSYGNIPTGAIGISGTFVPVDDVTPADVTLRFVSDDVELPYHPVQHLTHAGKHVIYAPLVMYMLGSGDHYFQAYASISSGLYEIEAEQFTLQVLTIGTGGGVKSPDTYLSAVFDRFTLNQIKMPRMSVSDFNVSLNPYAKEPAGSVIKHTFNLQIKPINAPIFNLNALRAGVNEKRIIYADTIAFNYMTSSMFEYDHKYLGAEETSLSVVNDYVQDENISTDMEVGKMVTLEVDSSQYEKVETLNLMEVYNGK